VFKQILPAEISTYRDNASTFLTKDTPKSSTVVVPKLQKGYVTLLFKKNHNVLSIKLLAPVSMVKI
jgi:hypothetical protein